ncbi:MAG TPA: hypothetical protein PKX17_06715, partial [Candidatus Methanomethylicus sp.]|nr:hypothetical protein [Candidatus Methanomethylicus sp.]
MEQSQLALSNDWQSICDVHIQVAREMGKRAFEFPAEDLYNLVVREHATFEDLVVGLQLDYAKFAELVRYVQRPDKRRPSTSALSQEEQTLFFLRLETNYVEVWKRLCNTRP